MEMKDKTVVLTGAAGGIGAAIALLFAQQGAQLILVSRNPDKLEALNNELPGGRHIRVVADLSAPEGRQHLLEACGGGVDILVNNAGVNHFGLLQSQSESQIREMFELNAIVPVLLTRALLPQMRKSGFTIVNVGSGFGSIGFAGYCGYSASKFALRGFTEALRRELAGSTVKVLYLAPRATETSMNSPAVVAMNKELGNAMDSPHWVAAELLKLLNKSTGSRYLGWPERFFIKLNGLFPSIVDKALAGQLPVIRRQAMAHEREGS
ncbi:MAG: SDR family oxidoreductase [Proteobacteria bacterium]|nr:SDR family oxidoreductase [Pseudomonadota bacterium]